MHPDLVDHFKNPHRIPWNIYWRFGGGPSPANHVFVTGASRSGTSLMKTILTAHSHLAGTKSESTGLFKVREMRTFIPSCSFFQKDLDRVKKALAESRCQVEFYDFAARLICERQNKPRFADKYIPHRWLTRFLLERYPNARIVNMVRDGRDCFCSALRHPNIGRRDPAEFARFWVRSLEAIHAFPAHPRILDVSYEAMTQDPAGVVARIMEFVGEPFEETQLDADMRKKSTHLTAREYHQNISKPINASSMGRWRKDMAAADLAAFDKVAGRMLAKMGYEPSYS